MTNRPIQGQPVRVLPVTQDKAAIALKASATFGSVIPAGVYLNPLDRTTHELLEVHQHNVPLYDGNHFYPKNKATLYSHNVSLMQNFLGLANIREILENGPAVAGQESYDFCVLTAQMLMAHDLGELLGEAQSYAQKIQNPGLDSYVKPFEYSVATLSYSIAAQYAAKNEFQAFHDIYEKERIYFQSGLEKIKGLSEFNPHDYVDHLEFTHKHLEKAQDRSGFDVHRNMMRLSLENYLHFKTVYENCEIEEARQYSAAGLLAKLRDKSSCSLYVENAKAKYIDPSIACYELELERNDVVLKTIDRAEAFLPHFLESTTYHFGANFLRHPVTASTYKHIAEYVMHSRPYIFLSKEMQKEAKEPAINCGRATFRDFCREQESLLQDRRKHIHALEDKEILSNKELAAKAMCFWLYNDPQDVSLMDQDRIVSKDERDTFDNMLQQIDTIFPVKKDSFYLSY